MKKTSKLIASISLSLLAIGALGQSKSKILPLQNSKPGIRKFVSPAAKIAHKLKAVSPNYALIDYVDGDYNISGASQFTIWGNSPLYINRDFVLGDTTTSPLNSGTANANLITSTTVVYDTLWDDISLGYISPTINATQPLIIDTVWALMGYHNTSGNNDTLFVSICAVNNTGFANLAKVYMKDTIVLNTSNVPYNVLDSIQELGFGFNHLQIPITARHGWNFCINITVGGSKLDTVGLEYASQYAVCTGNVGITSAYTTVGVPDGRATLVNSFATGLAWFNSKDFGGNGKAVTWPETTGAYQGYCIGGNYIWYDLIENGCSDTAYFPFQDIGLYVQLEYNTPTGIANINTPGLSVNQNYPNPFSKTTQITYNLVKSSDVVFSVCDITGRSLINHVYGNIAPGAHEINLSANSFAPGIYFYTLKVNGNQVTKKMVITE